MADRILFKIWQMFPVWLQEILSRVVRPLFQVFAVAVILNKEKQVLLVKSTYQKIHPWGLPGGSLEYGESPEGAVVRELLEETGFTVEIGKFLLVGSWLPDRLGLYYLCTITKGEFQPTDEVSEIGYFSIGKLPDVRPLDIELIERLHKMVEDELA